MCNMPFSMIYQLCSEQLKIKITKGFTDWFARQFWSSLPDLSHYSGIGCATELFFKIVQ